MGFVKLIIGLPLFVLLLIFAISVIIMFAAGADLIGTSAGVQLLNSYENK